MSAFTTRPELLGTFGMVASTHWLASAAGMAMLERGGNAFDAAVATGFALQVVEPHLNGPGGEVPVILYSAERDDVIVINGQGCAPAAAGIDHFRSLGLDLIPGTGLLPACVPGAIGGWLLLLAEFGTLRLRDVLEHATEYASGGYPLLPGIATAISASEQLFLEEWSTSAEVYLVDGRAPRAGEVFRNEALGDFYVRLVAEGEAAGPDRDAEIEAAAGAFYEGFAAERIDAYFQSSEVLDETGTRHAGLLTGADMASWKASVEPPVTLDYGDYTVAKTLPWSQGPVFLQQLALLGGFDLASMGHNTTDYVHTVVECAKLAFADREAWYGDPAFVAVPLDELLGQSYARRRRELVEDRASLELRPGSPGGRPPRLPDYPQPSRPGAEAGEPTLALSEARSRDTCHVDVVDRHGNMVAATPSGGWLHGSPAVPGLGFALGTRAQMFFLQEGLPNSLEPRKRPRTTLTPSLALRSGEPYLVFGTPGGDSQDQWALLFWLAHVHFGMNLQEAIDAPMFHSTHFPSSFYPRAAYPGRVAAEERLGEGVVAELRRRGHEVVVEGPWSLGRVCAAAVDRGANVLKAAANPRGMQGYAIGR